MSIELLMSGSNVEHSAKHDLESVFYVLLYICTMYAGPGKLRINPGLEDATHPFGNWLDKTDIDWHAIAALKSSSFNDPVHTKNVVFKHVHPYFSPLVPMLNSLCDTVYTSFKVDGPNGPEVVQRGTTRPCGTHAAVLDVLKAAFDELPDRDGDNSGCEEEPQPGDPQGSALRRTDSRRARDDVDDHSVAEDSLRSDSGYVGLGRLHRSSGVPNKRGSQSTMHDDLPRPSPKRHRDIHGRFTGSAA
jgi:hypothetical protein